VAISFVPELTAAATTWRRVLCKARWLVQDPAAFLVWLPVGLESADRSQVYGWVERLLVGQEYGAQGKAARGLVRRYID
jgi:hypothetical protein